MLFLECSSVTVPMAEQPLINPRSFPILASVREDAKAPDSISGRFLSKICTSRYKKMHIKANQDQILDIKEII